ncbi:12042_t:CDS:2 [Funneliformis mosseae]|uniref:12042_t:CDS:1 n=1 Tax=Funneliformis mosseae TaxID=27381 RepID=A0A9N8ZI17_FUNMO|nr:12042_t:CDS:2 [Funneliformis mosseae]
MVVVNEKDRIITIEESKENSTTDSQRTLIQYQSKDSITLLFLKALNK